MDDSECSLCVANVLPVNRNKSTCAKCAVAFHQECFKRTYNGTSAVPGPDFICTNCAMAGNPKPNANEHKRVRTGTPEAADAKRSRSSSRGRPTTEETFRRLFSDFRTELKGDMAASEERIKGTVDAQFTAMREELVAMQVEHTTFRESVTFINAKYEEMKQSQEANTKDLRTVQANVDRLSKWSTESAGVIAKLEAGLNKQAQSDLANNLVITGLAKTAQPVDTFWKMVELMRADIMREEVGSVVLLKRHDAVGDQNNDMQTPHQQSTGQQAARQQASQAFVSDTILVRFRNNEAKGKLIKAKQALGIVFAEQVKGLVARARDPQRPRVIFFRDHLTNETMKLYELARASKERANYKFLWTKNGQIYMRKAEGNPVVRVNTAVDLEKLM